MSAIKALRGPAIAFRADPFAAASRECLVHHEDALVVIADGRIEAFGPYAELRRSLAASIEPVHYPDAVITAGFIDAHVHYPQLAMIGAHGDDLLGWLTRYTYPAEAAFADGAHAARVAEVFLRELLRAGTTTALVYCTVHPQSAEAFFAESARWGTRMIAGKVLMDRNVPEALRDTVETGYRDSAALIERWHGRGRNLYCVTPRFAPACTQAQLEAAGALLKTAPGLYLQTHLCESKAEIAWVRALFPERESYLDVYAKAGLVGARSVFGHGVHLHEGDFCTCHRAGAAIAHCPTSNLFLGSGLFRLFEAVDPRRPVRVGLGTDVGAGTSLSQLQTLNEAYKVAALAGRRIDAVQAFYLATAGSARTLHLEGVIGNLQAGTEADLVVLDPKATPLMAFRDAYCESIEERLAMLMTLGDDRAVRATYVAGECVYDRDRDGEPFMRPASLSQ